MLLKIFFIFTLLNVVVLKELTYYEVLGVEKHATAPVIRQAYTKLADKLHPDKNRDPEDKEQFIKITEAFDTLKDSESRMKYDLYGMFSTYTKTPRSSTQAEYRDRFFNGLYADDVYTDTLNPKTYQKYITEDEIHFINCYSPFCLSCQSLAPIWKKLAKKYHGIIKMAAINCKVHQEFCYEMEVSSYPTLQIHPYGMNGGVEVYRGALSMVALEEYIISHMRRQTNLRVVTRRVDKPCLIVLYIINTKKLTTARSTVVSYILRTLAIVVMAKIQPSHTWLPTQADAALWDGSWDLMSVYGDTEKELLESLGQFMPHIKTIDPSELQNIRMLLQQGTGGMLVLRLSERPTIDRVMLYRLRGLNRRANYGDLDCAKYRDLCLTFGTTEGWVLLKPGDLVLRAPPSFHRYGTLKLFIQRGLKATTLRTLSLAEFTEILDGDMKTWAVCLMPITEMAPGEVRHEEWSDVCEMLVDASIELANYSDVKFGIMWCDHLSEELCNLATNQPKPTIGMWVKGKQYEYTPTMTASELAQYILQLNDELPVYNLNEDQLFDITSDDDRDMSWLIVFFPVDCRQRCKYLAYQFRKVRAKLEPLENFMIGQLWCKEGIHLCNKVLQPTLNLYTQRCNSHYEVPMESLSEAPYMMEWALTLMPMGPRTFTPIFLTVKRNRPKAMLVFFMSKSCYDCFEKYADFGIAATFLTNEVRALKLNCSEYNGYCRDELVTEFPSLRLYRDRKWSTVTLRGHSDIVQGVQNLLLQDHEKLVRDVLANQKHTEL